MSLIPGQESEIPHAKWHGQKIKSNNTNKREKFILKSNQVIR